MDAFKVLDIARKDRQPVPRPFQMILRNGPRALRGIRCGATALALVFSELLQNALEHGGDEVVIELTGADGHARLTVADNGAGVGTAKAGTGLSIVQALVRDELSGTLTLGGEHGLRAEVAFPL